MAACPRTSRLAALGMLVLTMFHFGPYEARAQKPASTKIGAKSAGTDLPAGPADSAPAVATRPEATSDRPLPDINRLMKEVEAQEKTSEKTIRQYIYHVTQVQQDFDSHGSVKKSTTEERESFWVDGTFISRLLSRDGKAIAGDELKKQNEAIDKRIAAAKERAQEKAAGTAPPKKGGGDEVTFARFLELGAFSNPRRVTLNGRDTIAVDYAGDSKAKTRNLLEGAIHDLAGTVWVDEKDRAMVRTEGHFFDDFKVGGGLLADIHKGSWFEFAWTKVNDEVWLPEMFRGKGSARIAVFFNHSGAVEDRTSDYRKFQATATILPGAAAFEAPGNSGVKTPPTGAATPNSGTAPPP